MPFPCAPAGDPAGQNLDSVLHSHEEDDGRGDDAAYLLGDGGRLHQGPGCLKGPEEKGREEDAGGRVGPHQGYRDAVETVLLEAGQNPALAEGAQADDRPCQAGEGSGDAHGKDGVPAHRHAGGSGGLLVESSRPEAEAEACLLHYQPVGQDGQGRRDQPPVEARAAGDAGEEVRAQEGRGREGFCLDAVEGPDEVKEDAVAEVEGAVVEHDGQDHLMDAEEGLEGSRDGPPQAAPQEAGQEAEGQVDPSREAQKEGRRGGR